MLEPALKPDYSLDKTSDEEFLCTLLRKYVNRVRRGNAEKSFFMLQVFLAAMSLYSPSVVLRTNGEAMTEEEKAICYRFSWKAVRAVRDYLYD